MGIRDWPAGERPREKLLQRGARVLSEAELLAVLLRTGVRGLSAVDLARGLLARHGGLRGLLRAEDAVLAQEKGLGPAKRAQLQAALELARRQLALTLERGDALSDPQAVRDYLHAELRDGLRERFLALFLDSQNRVLQVQTLAEGTLDAATVYPREVLRAALAAGAAAVIFAHNHPSGVAEPSTADRQLTERLRTALALVDIRVLDHFVVGEQIVSFAERGWL
jgi:DNA replication and repair protein RadC